MKLIIKEGVKKEDLKRKIMNALPENKEGKIFWGGKEGKDGVFDVLKPYSEEVDDKAKGRTYLNYVNELMGELKDEGKIEYRMEGKGKDTICYVKKTKEAYGSP